jgi:hypothetical protein
MASPLVVSYDNAPTENTRFFIKTLERNGWNFKIIGEGETWKGYASKVNGYNNFLSSIDPDTIVILSDARDVLCVRSTKAFMEVFSSFRTDFVVCMELFCGGKPDVADDFVHWQCAPLVNYWKYHNIRELPHRKFVNSGLIAGRASSILKWLQFTIENKYEDDQYALCQYINKHPERISVDSDAILLHTSTFGVNAGIYRIFVQAKDSPTLAELYGMGAFFIHIPGIFIRGQGAVYNALCAILESNVCDKTL